MALGILTLVATAINRADSDQPSYVDLVAQCDGATAITIVRASLIGTGGIIVRGADAQPPEGPDLLHAYDWEPPAGHQLRYTATATDDVTTVSVVAFSDPIDYGGDWIMPVGRPELGMRITVEKGGAGALARNLHHTTATILNRADPVVVSFGRSLWRSTWTFLTLDDSERIAFLQLLAYPHIMFAPRPGFGVEEPVFLVVGETDEQRVVAWGGEQARRWSVELIQISRPPAFYAPPPASATWQSRLDLGYSWEEVRDTYIDWFDFTGFEEVAGTALGAQRSIHGVLLR